MKIGNVRNVIYVARNFTVGLTDLTLIVRKPNGNLMSPNIVFVEQGDGIYVATYTPDVIGIWQEKVVSVINGDNIFRSCEVIEYDLNDIKVALNTIDNKVSAISIVPGGYYI